MSDATTHQVNRPDTILPELAMIPEWIVWSDELNDRAVRVYAVLNLAAKGNVAAMTRSEVAVRANCSTRTLDRAVAQLEAAGAVTRLYRYGPDIATDRTRYVVHYLPGELPTVESATTGIGGVA